MSTSLRSSKGALGSLASRFILPKSERSPRESFRALVLTYGVAILAVSLILALAPVLIRHSTSLDLTLILIFVLLVTTWIGGKGPGLAAAAGFELVTIAYIRPHGSGSFTAYVFGHASIIVLYFLLIFVVSARRNA